MPFAALTGKYEEPSKSTTRADKKAQRAIQYRQVYQFARSPPTASAPHISGDLIYRPLLFSLQKTAP